VAIQGLTLFSPEGRIVEPGWLAGRASQALGMRRRPSQSSLATWIETTATWVPCIRRCGVAGGRASRVWAVEPIPQNSDLLRRNISRWGVGGIVTVVPAALGRAEGSAEFTYYPNMPGNSTCR
jgi:hypothetical protein